MTDSSSASAAVGSALATAERAGFRLAVIGRTLAMATVAIRYLLTLPVPSGAMVAALLLMLAGIGTLPLCLVGGAHERLGRYALFGFDAAIVACVIAFAPPFGAFSLPQNLAFLGSRQSYFYIILALSILTLSPQLVLWAGFCSIIGLAAAVVVTVAGMDRLVRLNDLPPNPTPAESLSVVLNADFISFAAQLNQGIVFCLTTAVASLAVHRARLVTRAHAYEEAERNRVQQLFGRYLPTSVAEQLIEAGQLAPQSRDATVLFADIEGFTSISERLLPAQLIELLNEFFGAATSVVDAQGGIVINYLGDAMIAAFNAPLAVDDFQVRAVAAARSLQALVADRTFNQMKLRVRLGIATGSVAAGTVGGAQHQAYTLYGDTVNLAQRLEQLNKEFGTECLICGDTFAAARSFCADAIPMGPRKVRGRKQSTEIFSLPSMHQAIR